MLKILMFIIGVGVGTSSSFASALTISNLYLVNNSASGQRLMSLTQGVSVNLNSLPTKNINVEALASSSVSKIIFQLDSYTHSEGAGPYALCGDWATCPANTITALGAHSLTVTPYDPSGVKGTPLHITFTITNGTSTPVVSISSLYVNNNSASGQRLMGLTQGTSINLSSLPSQNINVEAVASASVSKIIFQLDSNPAHTEGSGPYALCGDWATCPANTLTAVGTHNLTVTPYDAAGAAGTTLKVTFSVVQGTGSPPPPPQSVPPLVGSGVQNYYITPSGALSAACTQAAPCKTINDVDSRLGGKLPLGSTGTVIHLAPGTYSGAITTSTSGSSGARIRYISDTQYGARLIGSSNIIWTMHGAYTDIVGFDFDGSANSAVTQGIISYMGSENDQILNNKFHDLCTKGGCNNLAGAIGTCIFTGTLPTKACSTLIKGNMIYHNNRGAGTGQPTLSNGDGGLSITWGDVVQNNLIVDQGVGWCIQATHTSNQVTITNNTLINCDRGALILGYLISGSPTVSKSTITNNIIVNSGSGPGGGYSGIKVHPDGCGSGNIYANNLMYGNTPSSNYIFDSGCSNTSLSTQSGSNLTTFVNYTGTISGDYRLRAGSAAIGHGSGLCATSACTPSTDLSGVARPSGVAIDIGAYKY